MMQGQKNIKLFFICVLVDLKVRRQYKLSS